MKACDFIVKYLIEKAGIKHVFTFAGGTSAMLLDSMSRHGGIKIIPMRHEENIALAADAYARIKRNIGLALAMSGPGATNMITGIAHSYFDSSPVFYLTGNVTTGTYKYDLPLRQRGYQETDIVSIVKPITKNAYFIDRIERVASTLRAAIRECLEKRRGPCLYDIPFDIQKLEVEESELNLSFKLETKTSMSLEQYNNLTKILKRSKKPLILAGGGVQLSGTASYLTDFCRKLKIPLVSSLLGKDAFPNDDPLYLGFIGSYGNRYANIILDAADVVIGLGTRIDSRQTANIKEFMRNKQIIHVDIDSDVLGSTVNPALCINMDLCDFFRDFADFEAKIPFDWQAPSAWIVSVGKIGEILKNDALEDKGALNPKKFLTKLTESFPAGTIYTVDVGSHQMWSAQCSVLKQEDRILYSGGLGTMGYAIPAAIGASFASPESTIVAIVGDGGFQMSIPELQTICEFKIPIKIVVMNNSMLGLMKNFQDENFSGRNPATVIGYSVPDICKIAAAYGLSCMSISKNEQFGTSLEWLVQKNGPAVLEVKVPAEWGPYPKVLPGSGLAKQHPPLSQEMEAAIRKELL